VPQLIPLVIGAVATIGAGSLLGTGVIFSIGTFAVTGTMLAGFIGAVVSTIASVALSAMMGSGQKAPQVEAQDRKQTIRGSIEARRVVYGEARVGGVIVYAASAGPDRERLHLVVVLAGHPCQSIESVFIGDTAIPAASLGEDGAITDSAHPLHGKVRIWRYLGNQTTADARLKEVFPTDATPPGGTPSDASVLDLPSMSDQQLLSRAQTGGFKPGTPLEDRTPYYGAWTDAHVLRGCAYVHVELTYDRDKFPNGLQNISAVVRGKNDIWDPRNNTTGFTDNWALCVLDYLRSDFGLACASDELDLPFFTAAANQADEAVPLDGSGAATEPRWRLHGSFDLDRTPLDIVEGMVAAGAGDLVYVQGKYRLYGGAYRAPTASIGPSDFAGTVKVTTKPPRRELFNAVRGTFIDPARSYQAAEFPPVFNPSFDAEDGERIWRDLQLPFVRSVVQAQRVARVALLTGRDALSFTAPMKYSAIRFAVKQTVSVTHPDFGWSAKPFSIESWKFAPATGEVEVTFREHNAFNYAWIWENAAVPASIPDTALIDPLAIPAATGVSLTSTTQIQPDGTAVPALAVEWTAAPHPFVTAHEVQWRPSGGQWTAVEVPVPATRLVVPIAAGGVVHEARVRPVGGLARGPWTDIVSATAAPDTTAPGMPSGLTATGVLRGVSLNWTPPTDLDLARSEVQEAAASTGPWTKIGEADGSVFLRSGMPAGGSAWFRVRAVDRSGNAGPFTAAVQGTAALAQSVDIADQAVTLPKFGGGLEPITIVSSGPLPTTKLTETISFGGKLYRWNGAAYTAAVPAVDVAGTLSDAQIADLNAAKLTGTMDVARIADGALTDAKLRGGVSGNQIWNSTLDRAVTGWTFGGSVTATSSGSTRGTISSLGGAADNWRLSGYGSGFMHRASLGAFDFMDAYWQLDDRVAVVGGARYEAHALLLPRNAPAYINIAWYDAAGTYLSEVAGNSVAASAATDGRTEDRYTRSGVIATAPATARTALVYVRSAGAGSARTNPSVVFTKAYFGEARPNQTDLSVWTPGAFSTSSPETFGPGSIVNDLLGTVDAAKINGELANATIAASRLSTAVTASQIASVNAAVVSGLLENANLAAARIDGLITSDQIAGITAAKLTTQITATNIANDAITTPKIAAGAVVAASVSAGAITASKLTLTTGNLNPDPQFEDGAWWSPDANGWFFESAGGGNYPQIIGVRRSATILASTGFGAARRHIWTPTQHPACTVTPGQTLRLRAECRNDSNQNLHVWLGFTDAAGAAISAVEVSWAPGEGVGDGTVKAVRATAPAGAVYWRIAIYNFGGTAFSGGGTISDVTVQLAADASLIVDGAITAAKIDTDAVTAGKIQAGAITTGKIAAGAVTASKMTLVDGTNLVPDPGMEDDAAWSPFELDGPMPKGWVTTGVGQEEFGSVRYYQAAGSGRIFVYSRRFQVQPGRRLRAQLPVWTSANLNTRLIFDWLRADGAWISNTITCDSTAIGWRTTATAEILVPAGAVYAVVVLAKETGSATVAFGRPLVTLMANAELIVDGSISANELAANSVTADKIVAGAVTAAKLSVGNASNISWNGGFENGTTDGWQNGADDGGSALPGCTFGIVATSSPYGMERGMRTAELRRPWAAWSGNMAAYAIWAPEGEWDRVMAVEPGQRVQASVYAQTHRCRGQLFIDFYNASGTPVAGHFTSAQGPFAPSQFKSLADAQRWSIFATAPAGAAFARAYVRMIADTSPTTDPYLFFTGFMFGRALPNQTEADPYAPGGVSSISGGVIKTRTIAADRIVANAITANELNATDIFSTNATIGNLIVNRVITAPTVIAGDFLANGSITAPRLAADAVTASKILIVPGNINPDPSFRDLSFWSFDPSGWYPEDASGSNYPAAMGLARTATIWSGAAIGTARRHVWMPYMDPSLVLADGQVLRLKAKGRNDSNQVLYAEIKLYTAGGAEMASLVLSWAPGEGGAGGTVKSGQITVPGGAAYWRGVVFNQGTVSNFSGGGAIGDFTVQVASDRNLIVDGEVLATKIATGAVEAAKIAAGAVTTEKLSVGSTNQLSNSCATYSTWGWNPFFLLDGNWSTPPANATTAALISNPTWALRHYGSLQLYRGGTWWGNFSFFCQWQPENGNGWRDNIPVVAGRRYQMSGLLQAHRCRARFDVVWLNAAGTYLSEVNTTEVENFTGGGAGLTEADYQLRGGVYTAPAGAAQAIFRVVMVGNGGNEPYVFATKMFFGECLPNAVELQPWAAGGVTGIEGGSIRANTITAREINANDIFGNSGVFNTLRSAIAGFGGLSANEIAAGAITATKIASAEVITQSVQVANLIIGSTKITDAAILTGKINGDAVTSWTLGENPSTFAGPSADVWYHVVSASLTVAENRNALVIGDVNHNSTDNSFGIYSINAIPPGGTEFGVVLDSVTGGGRIAVVKPMLLTPGTWQFKGYWRFSGGQPFASSMSNAVISVLARVR
jgi:hypothetical protein